MKTVDLIPAWGRILQGHKPFLSIEITKECPLQCPGCYAYGPDHLGGSTTLRELRDAKGEALVTGVLALVRRYRPLHVSIVGVSRWSGTVSWRFCYPNWRLWAWRSCW